MNDNHEENDNQTKPNDPLHNLCRQTGTSISILMDYAFTHPSSLRPVYVYIFFYILVNCVHIISFISYFIGLGTIYSINWVFEHNRTKDLSIAQTQNFGSVVLIFILTAFIYLIAYIYRKMYIQNPTRLYTY